MIVTNVDGALREYLSIDRRVPGPRVGHASAPLVANRNAIISARIYRAPFPQTIVSCLINGEQGAGGKTVLKNTIETFRRYRLIRSGRGTQRPFIIITRNQLRNTI